MKPSQKNCGGFSFGVRFDKMLNQSHLNKLCDGLEKIDRATAIKKLIAKGYSIDKATEYYNLWRKYYITTFSNID